MCVGNRVGDKPIEFCAVAAEAATGRDLRQEIGGAGDGLRTRFALITSTYLFFLNVLEISSFHDLLFP